MTTATKPEAKGHPIPVRYERQTHERLTALSKLSGLPVPAIIRAAVKLALPKLESGEVNILTPAPRKGARK